MYCLEESQLLEDNIEDAFVLEAYKVLHANESSNDREPLIALLDEEKFSIILEQVREIYGLCKDGTILTSEQKDSLLQRLKLEKKDAASLLLIVAATLTQLFVIDNFTGPHEQPNGSRNCFPEICVKLINEFDFRSLSSDGYEVYHLVVNPWLLKAAQVCWSLLDKLGVSRRLLELEFLVWKHRYLTIHLSILHEPSESILKELGKVQEFIFDHHIINDERENKTQLTRFNIVELCCELTQSALLRGNITASRKMFDYASELSGVSIEHTGVLGKRTKFQQKNIPQLVVRVTKSNVDYGSNLKLSKFSDLPKEVELDDDTLLPEVSFVNDDDSGKSAPTEQDLSPEAQLLMLTRLDYILKTEVMEESLKDEWTQAYLRSIIKSASIWALKYKALALRSVVEKKQMRKMDRALLQLEDLIKITDVKSENVCSFRLQSFYAILPLSKWQMQKLLGDISFDLGLYKNALDVYTRIEYWEGIIKCYSGLGETVKAEALIRQELAKQETPYLYCLLGDATDNLEYYEKSWTLSGGRFGRAKKSIGTYHYVRKDYEKAIENYEMALKASPSNISILSLLAYSCLILERYERAAECYRNLTYQDDTSFLAWNNLSKAYIKLNQKERAWRTLREAIKCNFEEWKIWENFMTVSVEIGAFCDVIMAWHRIIDIKNSHKDDQILSALTFALLKRSFGEIDQDFMKLLDDALKLVARIVATGANSTRTWICYFRLLAREYDLKRKDTESLMSKTDIDVRVNKMKNALQRATPNTMLFEPNWFSIPEKVDRLLDSYSELIECYTFAINLLGPRAEIWSQWKSSKLVVSNTMKVLRLKGYSD